jgi:release factor glutamine methyltransferase
MSTIQSLLKQSRQPLAKVSDSPQLDAELLLAHCLDKERSYLYAWGEKQVDKSTEYAFNQLVEKRLTDYPIAYLLGTQDFWSLALIVTEDVLIPRPETELLVEMALEKIQYITSPKILDLGTGSGAIALALATERPDAFITASDYSHNALAIAQKNAQQHALHAVNFIQSDWFATIKPQVFDLIVANPPYIKADDLHLQQGIRHEPLQALVAGKTGLDDINNILANALAYMKKGAWIMIEHGYDQGDTVPQLMQHAGLQHTDCIKDYSGNNRLSIGMKLNK